MEPAPAKIDLKKDRGLTVQWADGSTSYYTIAYLRRMSPSADMRQLRDEMNRNPLTVLPSGGGGAWRGGVARCCSADQRWGRVARRSFPRERV